jgi:hypothetical protein
VAGGVAANLHGSVRATRDIDVLGPREAAKQPVRGPDDQETTGPLNGRFD